MEIYKIMQKFYNNNDIINNTQTSMWSTYLEVENS